MFDLKSEVNIEIYHVLIIIAAALMYIGSFVWGCIEANTQGEFWLFFVYYGIGSLITTTVAILNLLIIQLFNNVNIIRQCIENIGESSSE